MQGFSRKYLRKKQETNVIKDDYDLDLESMTKKTLTIESKQYVQFAQKKEAFQFIRRSYTIVALGFITSAITYPLAVRLVKRVFGFKTFFNIHFTILPIILNVNALVLGAAQGLFNYYQVKQNYKINLTDQYL